MPGESAHPDPGNREARPRAIHAPWRLPYLESLGDTPQGPRTGCFIRDHWLAPERDVQNHVVVRTADGLIMLNAYPYANGHLLVALGEGRPTLLDYAPAQRAALWGLVEVATELMTRTLNPQGINIGINQGRAAGAGIPQHLHVHLVPRWEGDVNFLDVVGQIRVIPAPLDEMAARFRRAWTLMEG